MREAPRGDRDDGESQGTETGAPLNWGVTRSGKAFQTGKDTRENKGAREVKDRGLSLPTLPSLMSFGFS